MRQRQLEGKLGDKEPEGVEGKTLTLASSDNARRSVADLKTAVCCFL